MTSARLLDVLAGIDHHEQGALGLFASEVSQQDGQRRATWSEGQARHAPRQRSKSTGAGPVAVDRSPATSSWRAHARPRDPRVVARSCPGFVAILACLETTLPIRARRAPYVPTHTTSPTSGSSRAVRPPGRAPGPILCETVSLLADFHPFVLMNEHSGLELTTLAGPLIAAGG